MKKILTVTLVAALALFASSAYANFCARDVVPANTLLVPYVVVSMSGNNVDPNGYTTILSVTNTSSTVAIIHVVIWNALSEGILDFDQVLSGYDVWDINFQHLLNGHWSNFQTSLSGSAYPNVDSGSLVRKPFEWGPDGRSAYNAGAAALPTPDKTNALNATAFASCNNKIPFLNDQNGANYAPVVVSRLQEPLTAKVHGGCTFLDPDQVVTRHTLDWLSTLSDNPLVFYVTVDNFRVCDLKFPGELHYFDTDEAYSNVLIGEVYYLNYASGYSESWPAVHIESDRGSGLMATSSFQFYDDVKVDSVPTYLEPLGTAFGFRYFNDNPTITSSVVVWKNTTEFYDADTVEDCGSYLYYAWDKDEHNLTRGTTCPYSPCGGVDIDPNEFPFEVQSVPLTTDNFDLPATSGWMLIVFPPSYDAALLAADPTPEDDGLLTFNYMAWVGVQIKYQGFSTSIEAATMASAHCFETQVLPILGINYNYTDGNHIPAWW